MQIEKFSPLRLTPPSSKPTLPLIRVTECHSFFIQFKPYFTAGLVYTKAIASITLYNFKTHLFFLFFIITISYIFLFITSFLAHFYLHYYNHGAKTCQLGPTCNTQFNLINQLTFFKQAPGHEFISTSSIKKCNKPYNAYNNTVQSCARSTPQSDKMVKPCDWLNNALYLQRPCKYRTGQAMSSRYPTITLYPFPIYSQILLRNSQPRAPWFSPDLKL